MSLMQGKTYDALIEAGVTPGKAQAAAEELAGYDSQLSALRLEVRIGSVLIGLNTSVLLAVLWMLFRLAEAVARLEAK
jgi:hypothetical protein